MGAIGYRVLRWIRSSARSSALLIIVVAIVAAIPLSLAAGARRTATAPDRYTAWRGDVLDVTAYQDEGPPVTGGVADLPAARAVASMTFVFGALTLPGDAAMLDAIVFAGSSSVSGDRIVTGRAPDPQRPGEFVANRSLAEANDLAVGDPVQLITISREQAAEFGFDVPHADGPTVEGVLVGLIDGPGDLSDPTPIAVFSPSLLRDERIGTSGSVISIGLADGASMAQLREQLDTIPGGGLLRLEQATIVSPETRRAVDSQGLGLWLLAAIAAGAAVATVGYLLVRHARLRADETSSLAPLGYTRLQVVGESTARAAVIVTIAMVPAAGLAMITSGIFPFGFVSRLEPHPGLRVDGATLALGALVMATGLIGWVALLTWARRPPTVDRHPPVVDTVAARCPSASMATGLRFAFTSRDSTSLVARLGGVALMVAVLVGTLTFAVSAQRLVDEPARYGANFDALADNGADEIPADLLAMLQSDPDIAAVTTYTSTQVRVADSDTTLALAGMERMRGLLDPQVLDGRLPSGPEEVAIGRVSARRLGVSIGDELRLSTDGASVAYEITGLIVPLGIRGNDLVGEGAVVTSAGYDRVDPDAVPSTAAVRLRADADAGDRRRLAEALGATEAVEPTRPPAIAGVARITYLPYVLAALIAFLALLVVVSAEYTGVRRRNHHVAVLRSLGADRRWLLRVTQWQSIAATVVPTAIGVPLGIIAGRLVFRAYADGLGTVNDAATPFAYVVVGLAALIGVAAVAATIAGHPARCDSPALLLRTE